MRAGGGGFGAREVGVAVACLKWLCATRQIPEADRDSSLATMDRTCLDGEQAAGSRLEERVCPGSHDEVVLMQAVVLGDHQWTW